jgi:hypothetical protein
MVRAMRESSMVGRATVARAAVAFALILTLLAALCSCGSSAKGGPVARTSSTPMSCPEAVLFALGRVVRRVYHEGVTSERTEVARTVIAHSGPLREGVEAGNPAATHAAARALVAGGRLTNLRVLRGGRVLADAGGPGLAPFRGTITGAGGRPIGSYVASVWSDQGFVAESNGIGQGLVALREHDRSVGGSLALPRGTLPAQGTLTHHHVLYQYTSFAAQAFPSGSLRVYLLKSVRSASAYCGANSEETTVNTLSSVAHLIYAGEAGARTMPQVRRVQRDSALLAAVARRDPAATRAAVERLLNQHIVRLRVSSGARLLADVGGPYVLAPVRAALRSGGRPIGNFVLSIQDDEGYLRLTKRLAGLSVLMYMGTQLVKNSLGPQPGTVPQSGPFTYRGRSFRVYTVHASAFPSGPLRISVLIPIPYS